MKPILNIYTYKGPKCSLIEPWISIGYLTINPETDNNYRVPHLKHLFERLDNLNKYEDLIKGLIDIKSINACEININGEYAVKNSEDHLIYRARWYPESFEVNIVSKPNAWYEKIAVICAVFYRTEYIKRMSRPGYNLLRLDGDLESHLDELITYKHLPPMYIWDKTMEAVQNIEPKPRWWYSELNYLRRELNYDEPC